MFQVRDTQCTIRMLRTKSIRANKSPGDGLRISVMSRHPLRDGKTPNPAISEDLYNLWLPELASNQKLVGQYYRDEIDWLDFAEEYKQRLVKISDSVLNLSRFAVSNDVTVLCVEEEPTHCHRRLLAESCQDILPVLDVVVE